MSRRIDDIEVLRAIAILAVVIEHAERNLITWHSRGFEWLLSYVRGWSGVDLFFAVSGFVIARDLLPKLQNSVDFRAFFRTTLAFWIRRAWRILPSAWLWLAIILLAAVAFNRSGVFRDVESAVGGTVAAVLQYANIRFAHCFARYECGANFYYWSLSLEEQFYLLLPLVFFVSRRWLPHVLAFLILIQLLMPGRSILMINLRTDGLLLGVMIAIWSGTASYRRFEPCFLAKSGLARLAVIFLLLFALGYTTAVTDAWKLAPFRFSIIALISTLLVWIASYDKNYLLAAKPLKAPMMWIGARSYAMYLIHPFVYAAIIETWYRLSPKGTVFNEAYTLPFVLTATVSILVLCDLNYRLIEIPLRRIGVKIASRIMQGNADNPGFEQQAAETCSNKVAK
jgi:peptidoglycan/LPS O-acetylase OafA/YrhL